MVNGVCYFQTASKVKRWLCPFYLKLENTVNTKSSYIKAEYCIEFVKKSNIW